MTFGASIQAIEVWLGGVSNEMLEHHAAMSLNCWDNLGKHE